MTDHYVHIRSRDLHHGKGLRVIFTDTQGNFITPPLTTDPNRTGRSLPDINGGHLVRVVEDVPPHLTQPLKCLAFAIMPEMESHPSNEEEIKKFISSRNRSPMIITLEKVQTP